MIRCSQKKTHFENSSFLSKTGLKMLFNEEFYNVMELKIYSGYGSILPWIQSICNEELKDDVIFSRTVAEIAISATVQLDFE